MHAMHINRRAFASALAAMTAAWPLSSHAAQAEIKMLRILVGFPPGGVPDSVARHLADKLRPDYAQAAVVDNRPGADGKLALNEMTRSSADGSAMVVQPETVLTAAPYSDPKNAMFYLADVAPVTPCALMRQTLAVGSQVPANVKTIKDFFDWAKANPQLANCGSPGPNSPQGILINTLSRQVGVPLNHVPYKGAVPGVVDLLGGQIAGMLSSVSDYLPHLKEGRLRLLGIASAKRSVFVPDVPIFQEQGFPDMNIDDTCGIVMAKNTPAEIQNRVATAVAAMVSAPETIQAFAQVGLEPMSSTPAEYTRALNQNAARWVERIKALGVRS